MNKFSKSIALLILSVSIGFMSCKKKNKDPEPAKTTTVAEDKQNIKRSFDQMNSCIGEAKSGKLVTLVKTMFEINQGKGKDQPWLETLIDSLPNAFDFEAIETDGKLDFSFAKGVYTYNSTKKEWTKTTSTNNEMVFMFPSKNGGTNDLKLKVTGYTDESHNFDGETISLPKTFLVNFSQNGATLVEINLKKVTYKELQTVTIPTYIEATMVLAPLNINFVARLVNPTLFDMNIDVTNGSACDLHLQAELKVDHDDYENLQDSDFNYAKGSIAFGKLKLATNVDIKKLVALENPTDNQINALVDVDVLYDGVKIGDLEVQEKNDVVTFNIIYKDGTKEDVNEAYIKPFLDQVELTLLDLVGNWN